MSSVCITRETWAAKRLKFDGGNLRQFLSRAYCRCQNREEPPRLNPISHDDEHTRNARLPFARLRL